MADEVLKFTLQMVRGGEPWEAQAVMPAGARVVNVARQSGRLRVWAVCDRIETRRVDRRFVIVGDGQPLPPAWEPWLEHVGTLLLKGGEMVVHVFSGPEVGDV